MAYPRTNRIATEIKKIVSSMILNELKDPRISPLTSVVEVEVTRDLSFANIFISVYGNKKEKDQTLKALANSTGFVRKEIGKKIKLRCTPEPVFKLDSSIENAMYISDLIHKVNKPGTENEQE